MAPNVFPGGVFCICQSVYKCYILPLPNPLTPRFFEAFLSWMTLLTEGGFVLRWIAKHGGPDVARPRMVD